MERGDSWVIYKGFSMNFIAKRVKEFIFAGSKMHAQQKTLQHPLIHPTAQFY